MKTVLRRPSVAICGPRDADEALIKLARGLGEAIARKGWTLVCGGMGGVMAAACQGAAAVDGAQVVGIIPSVDAGLANSYCTVVIPTGMGVGRNVLVVGAADAVVLLGGGAGTLSEAALAWQLEKPIVALSSGGGWAAALAGTQLDARRTDQVVAAGTQEEILDALVVALC